MSIKGISDVRRLPRMGKIRLGIKKKTAKGVEYPSEVDYFILDPEAPDQKRREALIKQFEDLYGEKPKSIKVMFPPVPREMFFAQFLKRYGKGTLLKCKGDNEVAETIPEFADGLEKIGETDRGFIKVKCLGEECPYTLSKECGRIAALQVILPELSGIGVWQITTGSYNSIVSINSAIDYMMGLFGRYAMLPITLVRKPVDISYEGKRSKHYILDIDLENVSIGGLQKFALITPVERALIPAPDESKDELFYDKNGHKPPQIEDQSAEEPETAPGAPTIDLPAETAKEPEKPENVKPGPKAQDQGPMAKAFAEEMASRQVFNELKSGISTCKDIKSAKEYIAQLKEDGYLDKLRLDHKDELRSWTITYLKGLKK